MKEMHDIQINILKKLLFSETLRFTDLKAFDLENSQFTFHLEKLVKEGFITKVENGYILTNNGKEFANRMDTSTETMKLQAKVTTILCCERIGNGKKQFLIYTRLKNPFFGHIGFPTHKVWFGEKIKDAAINGLKDECGLSADAELMAIRHYHVYHQGKLMEDKIMHIFRFKNPTGELANIRDGEYKWVNADNLSFVNVLPEFNEVVIILNTNKFEFFKEVDQLVNNF